MSGALFFMALAVLASFVSVSGAPLRRQAASNTGLHPIFSIDGGQNYCINVTLDEVSNVSMQVDTGGSDTWVIGFTDDATEIHSSVDLRPRDSVKGTVFSSRFQFGDVKIPSQNMLQVHKNDSFSFLPGVMGLGRSGRSAIFNKFDGSKTQEVAASLVDTYSDGSTKKPFFTLHMPRGNTTNGTIGFGALDPQFADVTKQPFQEAQPNLWRTHLDMDLGITVNGRNISLATESQIGGAENLTVSIDTGFTYTTIRPDMIAGIYSIIPTAVLNITTGIWSLPCNSEINMTIHLTGGVPIPIHPLDMLQDSGLGDGSCIGSIQAQPSSLRFTGDLVLGTNFMHNAYTLFSTSGLPANKTKPYIQMLPLTDPAVAHKEFIASLDKDGPSEAAHSSDGTANAANVNFDDEAHRLGLDKNGAGALRPSFAVGAALAMGLLMLV